MLSRKIEELILENEQIVRDLVLMTKLVDMEIRRERDMKVLSEAELLK